MYKFHINNNKSFLYHNLNKTYIEIPENQKLNKLFDGDIINEKYDLIESKIRDKLLVGVFSTSQTQRFGKNKKGNVIYLVKPLLEKMPNFLIPYGGKLKGKIIIRFKYRHWNEKLPMGEIINVIGVFKKENLNEMLMYHYEVFPKSIRYPEYTNSMENNIKRKKYSTNIFSIDPDDCEDIDDALSIEEDNDSIIIGVHIAQPIYYLSKNDIENKLKYQFSTLYLENKRCDLWGSDITNKSSLHQGEEKPAYTILFHFKDNELSHIEDFPSIIVNKKKLSYDNANTYSFANKLLSFTNQINKKVLDFHELVSIWMVKTNNYIGKKMSSHIPLRVNKKIDINIFDDIVIDEDIKDKFKIRNMEAAEYSYTSSYHESLDLNNYCHFTSPIRRLMDTIIHMKLTYNENPEFNLDQINFLDKQTKKFHRNIQLNSQIDQFFKHDNEVVINSWIYQIKKENILEVFTKELGFLKVKLYDLKFDYLIEKKISEKELILNYYDQEIIFRLGEIIKIKLSKRESLLQKINISLLDFNII